MWIKSIGLLNLGECFVGLKWYESCACDPSGDITAFSGLVCVVGLYVIV